MACRQSMQTAAIMTIVFHSDGFRPCAHARPERLFTFGFRTVLLGYQEEGKESWTAAWNCFSKELGTRDGRHALDAVWQYARSCRENACRTLSFRPPYCSELCRDERLALGFVASVQSEDRLLARICADQLFRPTRFPAVEQAAFSLGAVFLAIGLRFNPILPDFLRLDVSSDSNSTPTLH